MRDKIFILFALLALWSCGESVGSFSNPSESGTTSGINGSYTKILVVGDHLYGLIGNEITTLDISDKENVVEKNKQQLAFDIESIYHFDGVLYIGSSSRLYIYEIDNNGIPRESSETQYFVIDTDWFEDCVFFDPVISNGKYAYVTLRFVEEDQFLDCSPNEVFNELRVYDVEDLENPVLKSTRNMVHPKGLTMDNNILFVCDDSNGLVIFDITDPINPVIKTHFEGFTAYDLIAHNGILIVIATDQFLQFDYTDPSNIKLISKIDF